MPETSQSLTGNLTAGMTGSDLMKIRDSCAMVTP